MSCVDLASHPPVMLVAQDKKYLLVQIKLTWPQWRAFVRIVEWIYEHLELFRGIAVHLRRA
jgi:hypothetical protein